MVNGQVSRPTDIRKAIFWMGVSLVFLSAMAVSIRETAKALSVFELLSLRNLSGIIVFLAVAAIRPSLRSNLRPRRLGLHLFRNAIHFGGTYAWAFALTLLPLAKVFALDLATPIFTAVLAVILLGEKVTLTRFLAIAAGAAGILIIQQPTSTAFNWLTLLPLAAAGGFALAGILTKRLTQTESSFAIMFWMNVIQLPLNLAGSDWGFWLKITPEIIVPVIGVCVTGIVGQFALTNALRHGDAITVAPLDFIKVPLAASVGVILYGEPLDLMIFAGAAFIIVGVVANLRSEVRAKCRAEKAMTQADTISPAVIQPKSESETTS